MYGLQAGGRKAWDMRNTIITESNIKVHDQTKSFGSICFFSQRFHQKTDAHFTGGDWEGWADATVSRCTHTPKKRHHDSLQPPTEEHRSPSRWVEQQIVKNEEILVALFFFFSLKKTKQKTHTVHAVDSRSSAQQTFYILNITSQPRSVVFWPVSFQDFGSLAHCTGDQRPHWLLLFWFFWILFDSSSSSQSCLSSGDNILSRLLQVFKK